jgi:hypothetical protein
MTRLALALALVPVGVSAAATSPVHASRASDAFGGPVTLSGTFAHGLAEEPVVVLAKEHGEKTYSSAALLTTKSGGRWSVVVRPTIETSYEATSLNDQTPPLTIGVRPKVTLGRTGRQFVARVVSTVSYEHHFVLLQRRARRGWKTLQRVVLGRTPRRFRVRLPHGLSRVRIFLPRSQAGAGYLPAFSRTVSVRR